jgi:hypothetical protein
MRSIDFSAVSQCLARSIRKPFISQSCRIVARSGYLTSQKPLELTSRKNPTTLLNVRRLRGSISGGPPPYIPTCQRKYFQTCSKPEPNPSQFPPDTSSFAPDRLCLGTCPREEDACIAVFAEWHGRLGLASVASGELIILTVAASLLEYRNDHSSGLRTCPARQHVCTNCI